MRDTLQTKNKLIGIGMLMNPICSLCDEEDESNLHLFFQCRYVREVWTKLLSVGAYHNISQSNKQEWFMIFISTRLRNGNSRVLLYAFKVPIQDIWNERNSRLFEHTYIPTNAISIR